MARRLGIGRLYVFNAAAAIVREGKELTVAAVAERVGCQPPSIYHHAPGGLAELQAYATEQVLVPRIARVINDEGWTCEYHEPEDFGQCTGCVEGQLRLARRIVAAL